MKLLSALFVLAILGTTGAAVALAYTHPDAASEAYNGRVCAVSGYMMYCS